MYILLVGLGLSPKLMHLLTRSLFWLDDVIVSDVTDVVVYVIVDNGDIISISLDLFFFEGLGLALPLVVDVGDVKI